MKQKYFFFGKFGLNRKLNSSRLVKRFFISYNLPFNLIKYNGKYDLVKNQRSINTDLSNLNRLTVRHLFTLLAKVSRLKNIKTFRLDLDAGNITDENGKTWKVIPYVEYSLLNDINKTIMLQRFEEFNFNLGKLREFYLKQQTY